MSSVNLLVFIGDGRTHEGAVMVAEVTAKYADEIRRITYTYECSTIDTDGPRPVVFDHYRRLMYGENVNRPLLPGQDIKVRRPERGDQDAGFIRYLANSVGESLITMLAVSIAQTSYQEDN